MCGILDRVKKQLQERQKDLSDSRERVLKEHSKMVSEFPQYLENRVISHIKQCKNIFGDQIEIDIKEILNVDARLFDWKSDFNKDLLRSSEQFEKETGLEVDITFDFMRNLNPITYLHINGILKNDIENKEDK